MVGLKEWQNVKKGDTIYIFHDIDCNDGMDFGLHYGTEVVHDVKNIGVQPYRNYDNVTKKVIKEERNAYMVTLLDRFFVAFEGNTSHCDCMNAMFFTTKEEYNEALKDQMEVLKGLIEGLQKEIDNDGTEKV